MDVSSCSTLAGFVTLLESLKLHAHREGARFFFSNLELEGETMMFYC